MWAETYERPLTDVLNIQREIAEKVTHSLSIELLATGAGPAQSTHVNLDSYDKYLLGLHELGEGTEESVKKAIQYFQEGIAEDPRDARLYSALAQAYNSATTYYNSPAEVMPRAKEAAHTPSNLIRTLPAPTSSLVTCICFSIGIGRRPKKNIAGRSTSIRACLKLNSDMPITSRHWAASMKRFPGYTRRTYTIRLRSKPQRSALDLLTSRVECLKPLSSARGLLSWNLPRELLYSSHHGLRANG